VRIFVNEVSTKIYSIKLPSAKLGVTASLTTATGCERGMKREPRTAGKLWLFFIAMAPWVHDSCQFRHCNTGTSIYHCAYADPI